MGLDLVWEFGLAASVFGVLSSQFSWNMTMISERVPWLGHEACRSECTIFSSGHCNY